MNEAHPPQPSLIALLRSAVDQLQQYRPYLQRNKSAAKGYIAVMQKCSEPEEGGEYGYLHKGFVMRAIEDACRDARPQSRPEAELPELPKPKFVARLSKDGEWAELVTPHWEAEMWAYGCEDVYTADQLRAYGQQCAATRPDIETEPVAWQSRTMMSGGYWGGWMQNCNEAEAQAAVRRYAEIGIRAEYRALCARPAEVGGDGVARDAERYRVCRDAIASKTGHGYALFCQTNNPETPEEMDALCDAVLAAELADQ